MLCITTFIFTAWRFDWTNENINLFTQSSCGLWFIVESKTGSISHFQFVCIGSQELNTVLHVHVHVFQSQVVPTSVFDRLQYGNTEGEDPGDLVTWVTSDRWRVKTCRVVPDEGSCCPSKGWRSER